MSPRQQKRIDWLRDKMSLDYDTEYEYLQIVELHNSLVESYQNGQDSCSTCGALFDVRDFNDKNECLTCNKYNDIKEQSK